MTKIVLSSKSKYCPLDPVPTSHLFQYLDSLIDIVSSIINQSLTPVPWLSDWHCIIRYQPVSYFSAVTLWLTLYHPLSTSLLLQCCDSLIDIVSSIINQSLTPVLWLSDWHCIVHYQPVSYSSAVTLWLTLYHPLSTSLLLQCCDSLIDIVSSIINQSLTPVAWLSDWHCNHPSSTSLLLQCRDSLIDIVSSIINQSLTPVLWLSDWHCISLSTSLLLQWLDSLIDIVSSIINQSLTPVPWLSDWHCIIRYQPVSYSSAVTLWLTLYHPLSTSLLLQWLDSLIDIVIIHYQPVSYSSAVTLWLTLYHPLSTSLLLQCCDSLIDIVSSIINQSLTPVAVTLWLTLYRPLSTSLLLQCCDSLIDI